MIDTHRVVREHHNAGFAVVRLRPRGKAPIERGWPDIAYTPDTLDAFQDGENVGAHMGPASGSIVDIDLDSELAVELAAKYLPATRTFGRASKPHSHWLYRVPNLATRKYQDADGRMILELRARGCQTMMPGSVHPSGEIVEWGDGRDILTTDAVQLVGAVEALATACGWHRKEAPARQVASFTEPRGIGYGNAALSDEVAAMRAAVQPGRNEQLNRSAFAIAQLVDAGELPASALEEIRAAARSTGLEEHRIESTMRSAIAGASRNPRAPRMQSIEQPTWSPPPPPSTEEAQRMGSGWLEETLAELASSQGGGMGGIVLPGFPSLSDALFGLRGVCLFTGPSGTGKTTLVNAFAVNTARGMTRERGDQHEPVRVVYLTAEMSRKEIGESMLAYLSGLDSRLLIKGQPEYLTDAGGTLTAGLNLDSESREQAEKAACILHGLDTSGMLAVIEPPPLRRWSRADGEHALQELQDIVDALHGGKRVLVIIDTLATLEPSPAVNETHRTDLDADRDIVDALKRWRKHLPTGSCILCIHEESKAATGTGDGHSVRGSSRYLYAATQRINLIMADSDGGTRRLELREGEPHERTAEVDIKVEKARRGGRSHSIIGLEHEYAYGTMREIGSWSLHEQRIAKSHMPKRGGKSP